MSVNEYSPGRSRACSEHLPKGRNLREPAVILAVVQARMSSTRLPGKVMAPILGEPMIAKQLERVRRAKTLSKVVVATSTDSSDEPLASYLASKNQPVFRGALHDV